MTYAGTMNSFAKWVVIELFIVLTKHLTLYIRHSVSTNLSYITSSNQLTCDNLNDILALLILVNNFGTWREFIKNNFLRSINFR